MHKKTTFAYNKLMQAVYFFVINNFLLFAPIFVSFYGIIDYKRSKVYFCITILGLNIFGGYATFNGLKCYLHYSNTGAKIIELTDYAIGKKKYFKVKNAQLYSINILTKVNFEKISICFILQIFNFANDIAMPIVIDKGKIIKAKNDFVLTCEENLCSYYKISVLLNLFCVTNALVNGLIRMVVKYVKRKKQR